MKRSQYGVIFAAGFMALLFTGCTSENELLKQRSALAVRHYDKSQYKKAPERVLTLQDCIQLALANTLDRKVGEFYLTVTDPDGMKDVLQKLPGIQYTCGGRKERVSGFVREGEEFSSLDLDIALGFMDLALACFNYRQDRNREWMRKQTVTRQGQNLAFDVMKAYVDLIVARRNVEMIEAFLKNTPATAWKKIKEARGIAPYKAFGLLRERNKMEKLFLEYTAAEENALYRLNSLMGYYPAGKLNLESPVLDNVPVLAELSSGNKKGAGAKGSETEFLYLPKLEMMEKIALLNRPELARQDGKEGVSSIECAKVILTLFPQLRLFFHYNGHGDDFLYNRSWWDLGFSAGINLLNLSSRGVEFHAKYKAWKADEVRTYAASIAVLSQVRLCHSALVKSAALLKAIDGENNYINAASRNLKNSGKAVSDIAEAEFQLQSLKARLQRLEKVKEFYMNAGRLIYAMGLNNLNADNLKACEEVILKAEEAVLKAAEK